MEEILEDRNGIRYSASPYVAYAYHAEQDAIKKEIRKNKRKFRKRRR